MGRLLLAYLLSGAKMSIDVWERSQLPATLLSAMASAVVSALATLGLAYARNWDGGKIVAASVGFWMAAHVLLFTPFRLWMAERLRTEEFEEAAKPKIGVSLMFVKEPKGAEGPVWREWRLLIRNESSTLLKNVAIRQKSLVNAQGLQSDSCGACFAMSKERWAQGAQHENFDLHPRAEEFVSIVYWNERESASMPAFVYSTPWVRNAIPHARWPHDLVVQISADNLPNPIEKRYQIDIEGERLSMTESTVSSPVPA